jgi:hypothetical protein
VGCKSICGFNNTKTRKLGVHNRRRCRASLSVKGSSIINFAEKKSVQKKLRRVPEVMLPDVLNGGKVFLRKRYR